MLSKLLHDVAKSIPTDCPFPVRIGMVIPRIEVKYPVVSISYAGTRELNEFVWHRIKVSCYVRTNYSNIENGEEQILTFVDWVMNSRKFLVSTNNNLNTAQFDLDTFSSSYHTDNTSFLVLEASYLLILTLPE